ncbi:hypothetical protein A2914_02570 [Candidatus Nomurabacteria bacterium RIFCSPLOWO2_01_FULL_41_21]|uniref:Uncharacterized protein n=2 Tax=Candidatus Nomuraibacteriota TaxID=1752729 RepID=A0A1F6V279_9BACT|nr:MAG: hypothetical protein A2733_01725 [Candidatus Nomurabacteria bacterium RIFCSPHIGHO2_01_FULL_40_20]OGI88547.1 MAG: hypothetical protein A2914_02570 [Candidatus Nomurabacteria bacterium RIFCSPLOWO2_01_FULL_41_21]
MIQGGGFSLDEALAQIPPSALWLGLVIFGALALVISLVLVFHWNKYKMHSPWNTRAQAIYVIGLIALLVLSAIALSIYTT